MAFRPSRASYSALKPRFNQTGAGATVFTQSALFDGIDERIEMGNVLDNAGTAAQSTSFWIKKATFTGQQNILNKGWPERWDNFYVSNKLGFTIAAAGANSLQVFTTAAALTDGAWNHCMLTYSGSKTPAGIKLYVNGVLEPHTININAFTGTSTNTKSLMISSRDALSLFYAGNVCSVNYWPTVRTLADAVEGYNGGANIDATTLTNPPTHSWLNDTAGDDLTAATGTVVDTGSVGGFDGTPVNTEVGDLVVDAP